MVNLLFFMKIIKWEEQELRKNKILILSGTRRLSSTTSTLYMQTDDRTSLQYSVINARLCFGWLSIGVKKKVYVETDFCSIYSNLSPGAKFLEAIKSELKPENELKDKSNPVKRWQVPKPKVYNRSKFAQY